MTRNSKQRRSAGNEFEIRLMKYGQQATLATKFAESQSSHASKLGLIGTMSAAAGAALSMTPAVEAGIRYSGIVNNTVERPNPAAFAYPGPPQLTYGAFGKFSITNTAGDTVGQFALAARIFNVYGYLGIAAFGSTPAIYNHCNAVCGPTDPNFQALGRPHPVNNRMRPSPVPEGIAIGPTGANFNENTAGGGSVPVSLSFFSQLPTPGNDDRSLRKWSYGSENVNFHLWEGSQGTLSAGEFAGIKLTIDGQQHFGWIRIAIANEEHPPGTANAHNGSPYKVTAVDWAYETTPNTAILAGDIGSITGPTGDYNGNHVVDAADYSVWRDTFGAAVPNGTGADGDQSGMIDDGDYTYWKMRFGNAVPGSGAGAVSSAVPEPTATATVSLGILALGASGVMRHRRAKQESARS
ncbi:MAG: hypothetical protein AB7I57_25420 [Pirellulales bacterium]